MLKREKDRGREKKKKIGRGGRRGGRRGGETERQREIGLRNARQAIVVENFAC